MTGNTPPASMRPMIPIVVGEPFFAPPMQHDGCRYEYIDSHLLVVAATRLTRTEIDHFQSNRVRVGFVAQPGVILFLARFAPSFQQIAPFAWHLVEPGTPLPEDVTPGHAALLAMALVDRPSNVVVAIRAATFTTRFTNSMHQAMRRQAAGPFRRHAYACSSARVNEPIDRLWACADETCILGERSA